MNKANTTFKVFVVFNERKLYFYFLLVLTMMTFVTPAPDTGERISLVLTSLVSMFFFLKLVSERTPASDTTPLLSVYFVMLSFEVRFFVRIFCVSYDCFANVTF